MRVALSQIQEIARAWSDPGEQDVPLVVPHGTGLIHDSFAVSLRRGGRELRVLVQRMNREVFRAPEAVLANIARVTEHVRGRLLASGSYTEHEVDRRVLRLLETRAGGRFASDAAGEIYRAYAFIDAAHAVTGEPSEAQAYQAARAFGELQAWLVDLPAPALHETLPGFHDTCARLAALEAAARSDVCGRAQAVSAELSAILRRAPLADTFARARASGELPLRVTHNDTKLDNVLFDDATELALCVVDLDTVMPGLVAHDFGDLARSLLTGGDPGARLPLLGAAARGYLSAIGSVLLPGERRLLAEAPRLLALELAARFLTDHLRGDRYFVATHANHNLERAREQLAIVIELEQREAFVRDLVRGS